MRTVAARTCESPARGHRGGERGARLAAVASAQLVGAGGEALLVVRFPTCTRSWFSAPTSGRVSSGMVCVLIGLGARRACCGSRRRGARGRSPRPAEPDDDQREDGERACGSTLPEESSTRRSRLCTSATMVCDRPRTAQARGGAHFGGYCV